MAIGPVVTRGFGSFGSVNLVVTRGFTASVALGPGPSFGCGIFDPLAFDTDCQVAVAEQVTGGNWLLPKKKRRRVFILPDGRRVLCDWNELEDLVEKYATGIKPSKAGQPAVLVQSESSRAGLDEESAEKFPDEPLKLVLPKRSKWARNDAAYNAAIAMFVERELEEDEEDLMLLIY